MADIIKLTKFPKTVEKQVKMSKMKASKVSYPVFVGVAAALT